MNKRPAKRRLETPCRTSEEGDTTDRGGGRSCQKWETRRKSKLRKLFLDITKLRFRK